MSLEAHGRLAPLGCLPGLDPLVFETAVDSSLNHVLAPFQDETEYRRLAGVDEAKSIAFLRFILTEKTVVERFISIYDYRK
jgi:hypothetical protein